MSTTLTRGPVRAAERSPAPDLARGFMLLLIAVANTPFYLWGLETSPGSSHPADGSWLDRVADVFIITAVDLRIYPMFAFMFGYGMMQLYSRQLAAGTSEQRARHLLQLRNMWLLIFGFVHAALLWMGDVLGAYGLAGLLLVWLFLRRKDTTLIVWAFVLLGLLAIGTAFAGVGAYFVAQLPADEAAQFAFTIDDASMSTDSYLASIGLRLGMWVFVTAGQGVLGLVVPTMILLAFWAGRRRILENPGDHLPLLRRVAAIGIPLGFLGALPGVLYHVGVVSVPGAAASILFEPLQAFTGFFGGLGYVALFGLVGHAVARRRREAPAPGVRLASALRIDGPVAGAVQAVGKRSLTCYLLQSVLCAPILTAWGLGVGQHLSSWSMLLFAVGVWGLTVVFAVWQENRGARGPAEVLLRRLAYGRPSPADTRTAA